jgi:hypothetical protein
MKNVAKIIKAICGFEQFVGSPPGTGQAIKVESPGFMALCIECIGPSPHGEGLVQISVAHYGEQNGDAMRDPDMVFDVWADPNCEHKAFRWDTGTWRPVSYRNDYVGVHQEAVFLDDQGRVMVRPRLLRDLKGFARQWDRNIKEQGFVEAALAACAWGQRN